MDEFVAIIVIYLVFRVIIAFLGAWWRGGKHNDFRRDRKSSIKVRLYVV